MRPLLTVVALLAVGLAGCADDAPAETPTEVVNTDEFEFEAGKGAIGGLLFDDRFRPIELTDNPQTEFQASGFVLLQETGQRTQTTENGEFQFLDLEPGTYTVRVSVEGHEATPVRTQVNEGEFAEAQLLARRIAGTSGFIISHEYAAFTACGVNAIAVGTPIPYCPGDLSGDTDRSAFTVDYTAYNASHIVMEMRANNPNYFDVWMRNANGGQSCSDAYQILGGPDVQFLRFQLTLNESAPNDESASGRDCESSLVWDNADPIQTVMYLNGIGFEQGLIFGASVYFGVQANFLQTAFVGPTEVDVDTYCVYCEA